jgi:2-C-methyl-D-erythritol 4-phosphate cytidylyltransferase
MERGGTLEYPSSQTPLAPRAVAVVLCAGQGARMGAARNKVFLPLGDRPVIVHTLTVFERAPAIDEVLLVAHSAEVSYCQTVILARSPFAKVTGVIAGGASRHQSEQRALDALRGRIEAGEIAVVLMHDGARPFVTPQQIAQVIEAARIHGAALLATPLASDELLFALADDGAPQPIASPHELMRAQTPQAFDARTLLAAYERARADGFEGTDTAASVERLGHAVAAVPGSRANLKITTPDDLLRAEALLRAGTGATS